MRPDFVFHGMTPYIRDVAAGSSVSLGERYISTALAMSPVNRVGQALAQATLASSANREDILRAALRWRETLALALAGVDAAISHVRSELGLSASESLPHGDSPTSEDLGAVSTSGGDLGASHPQDEWKAKSPSRNRR